MLGTSGLQAMGFFGRMASSIRLAILQYWSTRPIWQRARVHCHKLMIKMEAGVFNGALKRILDGVSGLLLQRRQRAGSLGFENPFKIGVN